MILDLDGEAFVRRVVRRPLGHRPGAEHAIHLQPQVEVQAPGGMLVHDEQPARLSEDGSVGTGRLGGTLERALGAVGRERIGLWTGA